MHPIRRLLLPVLLVVLGSVITTGCDDPGAGPVKPKDGVDDASPLRIVSLSPAITQMIIDMGDRAALVGVDESHATVFEKLDLPLVGTYTNLRNEVLLGLRPTHVVTMVGAEGPPAQLAKLAETGGFKVVTFPYPTSVRDVSAIIMGNVVGPGRIVSEGSLAALLQNNGMMIANAMNTQLGRIAALADSVAKPGSKPRVLLVFAIDPRIQASGPETVLDDLLTQYAGGYNAAIPDIKPLTDAQLNAIADPEKRKAAILAAAADPAANVGTAPTFDRERILEHKPDVILLFLPGEPPLESIETDPRLVDLRGLDIPAVKNGRVHLISEKTAQLPGTGLPKVAALMAKAIHPTLAPRIDAMFAPATPDKEEKDKDVVKPDPAVIDPTQGDPAKTDPAKRDAEKKEPETPEKKEPEKTDGSTDPVK